MRSFRSASALIAWRSDQPLILDAASSKARHVIEHIDTDAERLFEAAIARMEKLGGRAVEIDYGVFMETQRLLYEGPFLAERGVSVEPMIAGHEEALHPATPAILDSAGEWTARDAFKAVHRLGEPHIGPTSSRDLNCEQTPKSPPSSPQSVAHPSRNAITRTQSPNVLGLY